MSTYIKLEERLTWGYRQINFTITLLSAKNDK